MVVDDDDEDDDDEDDDESPFVLLVVVVVIADGILKPFEWPFDDDDDMEVADEENGSPVPKDDPPAAAPPVTEGATFEAPNALSCLMPLEKGRAGAVVLIPVVVAAPPNAVSPVKPPNGFEEATAGVDCGSGVVIGKLPPLPPKGPAENPAKGLFDDAVSDNNEEELSPPMDRFGRTIFLLASSSCDALAADHSDSHKSK